MVGRGGEGAHTGGWAAVTETSTGAGDSDANLIVAVVATGGGVGGTLPGCLHTVFGELGRGAMEGDGSFVLVSHSTVIPTSSSLHWVV